VYEHGGWLWIVIVGSAFRCWRWCGFECFATWFIGNRDVKSIAQVRSHRLFTGPMGAMTLNTNSFSIAASARNEERLLTLCSRT
jgi:hypothetical protein